LIGSASRGVSAALTCEGSLLLELLLAILFPKLHSIVFAFALELISVVTPSEIEGVLDPLLCMVNMLLLFLVGIGLMAASQLETDCFGLALR
jgi:predicted permease